MDKITLLFKILIISVFDEAYPSNLHISDYWSDREKFESET